jgi:hypothetical protein
MVIQLRHSFNDMPTNQMACVGISDTVDGAGMGMANRAECDAAALHLRSPDYLVESTGDDVGALIIAHQRPAALRRKNQVARLASLWQGRNSLRPQRRDPGDFSFRPEPIHASLSVTMPNITPSDGGNVSGVHDAINAQQQARELAGVGVTKHYGKFQGGKLSLVFCSSRSAVDMAAWLMEVIAKVCRQYQLPLWVSRPAKHAADRLNVIATARRAENLPLASHRRKIGRANRRAQAAGANPTNEVGYGYVVILEGAAFDMAACNTAVVTGGVGFGKLVKPHISCNCRGWGVQFDLIDEQQQLTAGLLESSALVAEVADLSVNLFAPAAGSVLGQIQRNSPLTVVWGGCIAHLFHTSIIAIPIGNYREKPPSGVEPEIAGLQNLQGVRGKGFTGHFERSQASNPPIASIKVVSGLYCAPSPSPSTAGAK